MANEIESLQKVPLFSGLSKSALNRLAKFARARNYKAGAEIVKEGDAGVGFFLIMSGKVEVVRGGKKLSTLGAGQYFGEMSLLDRAPRSATCLATEATETLAILRSDFVAELKANPSMCLSIMETLSRRVRELDAKLAG
jgi:CRP-like cAMP-binding protein